MKPHVYLASGWFNPAQRKQMEEVYAVLKRLEEEGLIDLFAPFYDGIVLKPTDPELRKKMKIVWWVDTEMVKRSALVVVCTQDHDVGTIYEAGFAGALGIPVLCYNSNPELGLNVMLAQAAVGFVKTQLGLESAIQGFCTAWAVGKIKDWIWNEWKGEPI